VNLNRVEKIANAVLYEGYILYPYRPTALKNQQRFNFGVLSPRAYSESQQGSDPWKMQTECLLQAEAAATLDVKVRFLWLVSRQIGKLLKPTHRVDSGEAEYELVPELQAGERTFQAWQEAGEADVSAQQLSLNSLLAETYCQPFTFAASREEEHISDPEGRVVGVIIRTRNQLDGMLEVSAEPCGEVFRLRVVVKNLTETDINFGSRDEALTSAMVSVHTILGITSGRFVSLMDPPEQFKAAAANCNNVGTWPVLAGKEGEDDLVLSSPIILYDYPEVAAESPGDLCDATETDELLTLCIMSLTDEEKRAMLSADDRARRILERTETLPAEQLLKMHGAIRGLKRVEEKGQ